MDATNRFACFADVLVESTCPVREGNLLVGELLDVGDVWEDKLLHLCPVVTLHLDTPIRKWLLIVESHASLDGDGFLARPVELYLAARDSLHLYLGRLGYCIPFVQRNDAPQALWLHLGVDVLVSRLEIDHREERCSLSVEFEAHLAVVDCYAVGASVQERNNKQSQK